MFKHTYNLKWNNEIIDNAENLKAAEILAREYQSAYRGAIKVVENKIFTNIEIHLNNETTSGDMDNEQFLIVDGTNLEDEIAEMCKKAFPEEDFEDKRNDTIFDEYIKLLGYKEWGYGDSYTLCSNCGNAVIDIQDMQIDYLIGDGEILCLKCIELDHILDPTQGHKEFVNNISNALPEAIFNKFKTELGEKGFKFLSNHDSYAAAPIDPEKIIETIDSTKNDFMFVTTNIQMFGASFDLYTRKKPDENE